MDSPFYLNGLEFRSVDELADYMRRLLDTSLADFRRACYRLVDYNGGLNAQFEAWLTLMGKEKELKGWRARINI